MERGELIGRGSSGTVFRGTLHERGVARPVAIKMLGAGATAKQQDSFLKEIRKSMRIGQRCR